jgi:hypothetical protein
MADDRPLVWVATPFKDFRKAGKIDQEVFEELEPHFREPIRQISLAQTLPWQFELVLVGGGGVARARNKIVSDAMRKKPKYVLFQDYDLMPKPQDYIRILNRMDKQNLMVCGGMYTIREDFGHWVLNTLPGAIPWPDGGLQVMELGTGFKCYRLEAFEKIAEKNPWLQYTCDDSHNQEWGFFSMGPVTDAKYWPGLSRWLTEDYWLDWLTRDADIPIIVDTAVQIRHKEGTKVYPKEFPPIPGQLPPEAKE